MYTTPFPLVSNYGQPSQPVYYGQPAYYGQPCYAYGNNPSGPAAGNFKAELCKTIRMLWEQHGTWTRLAIESIVYSLPDADAATNRLLRNPKDFEAVLKPFYGDQIAAKFSELLTSHLVIAAQLVKAAKAGDTKAAAAAEKAWYANADEIAAFLASINPYWSQEVWQNMMHEHLAFVKGEAVDMLNKKYQQSVDTYDNMEQQILKMADYMTEGIYRQFANVYF